MPLPEPVLTVTMYVAPDPPTAVMEVPVTPVVVRAKSATSTLLTDSEKVTVKSTLVALVGLVSARTILSTIGKGGNVGVLVGVLVTVGVYVGVGEGVAVAVSV